MDKNTGQEILRRLEQIIELLEGLVNLNYLKTRNKIEIEELKEMIKQMK